MRRAERRDFDGIMKLLRYIAEYHHGGRPDIFAGGGSKYNNEELEKICNDEDSPIFVAVGDVGDDERGVERVKNGNAGAAGLGRDNGEAAGDITERYYTESADAESVLGYCFCIIKRNAGHAVLNDFNSLYIDDFCVDPGCQKMGVGKMLFAAVKEYARQINVYEIDLNVWEFNEGAIRFYERCGFKTQRRHMELIL